MATIAVTPDQDAIEAEMVRWELSPREIHGLQSRGARKMGTGTALRLRHSGFAGDLPALNSHGEGWKRVLGWMQAFLEQGETVDTRKPITAAS